MGRNKELFQTSLHAGFIIIRKTRQEKKKGNGEKMRYVLKIFFLILR